MPVGKEDTLMDQHADTSVGNGECGRPNQADVDTDDIGDDEERKGHPSAAPTSVIGHHRPKTTPKRIIVGII